MLTQMPRREEHEPGLARRIAAPIAGTLTGAGRGAAAGVAANRSILEGPYDRAYQDWIRELGPLQKQADLELRERTASLSGLGGVASLLKTQFDIDPEAQADMTRAKTLAELEVKDPFEKEARAEDIAGRERVAAVAPGITAKSREGIAAGVQTGLNQRQQNNLSAAMERLNRTLGTRMSIADLMASVNRERIAAGDTGITAGLERLSREYVTGQLANSPEFSMMFTITEDGDEMRMSTLEEVMSMLPEGMRTRTQAQIKMDEFDDAVYDAVQELVDAAKER